MAIGVIVSIGTMRMLTGILDRLIDLGKYSFTSLLLTVNIATISLPYEPDTYNLAWTISGVFLVMAAAISILIMQKKDIR
jgi:predicted tellurium resistance membrane protein TerC